MKLAVHPYLYHEDPQSLATRIHISSCSALEELHICVPSDAGPHQLEGAPFWELALSLLTSVTSPRLNDVLLGLEKTFEPDPWLEQLSMVNWISFTHILMSFKNLRTLRFFYEDPFDSGLQSVGSDIREYLEDMLPDLKKRGILQC